VNIELRRKGVVPEVRMMKEHTRRARSRGLASRLFDAWVRRRQDRPGFVVCETEKELGELGLRNFEVQLAGPRARHLEELKEFGEDLDPAEKVALLVALELPAVEISTLLHKLSIQVAGDSEARYFSEVNQFDNCGCGCGCGCFAMQDLPPAERLHQQKTAKPFSIDPFNESGFSEKDREALRVSDFLESYEALSTGISASVNQRYFEMGRSFS
jgi:hypothetical protein